MTDTLCADKLFAASRPEVADSPTAVFCGGTRELPGQAGRGPSTMPIARADRGACDVDPSPSISTVISTSDGKGTPATRLGGLRSSEIWCGIAKFSKHEENGDDGQSRPAPPILSRTWPTCGEHDRRNRNEKVFRPIVRDRKGDADLIDARTSTASISGLSAGHSARPQLSLVSSTRVTPGAFGMRCASG
jgi:hypothetical protein